MLKISNEKYLKFPLGRSQVYVLQTNFGIPRKFYVKIIILEISSDSSFSTAVTL